MEFWSLTGLIIVQVLASLLLFALALSILVFLLRNQARKYKPLDLLVFDRIQPTVSSATNRLMLGITFLGTHQFLVPANLLLIVLFLVIPGKGWFSVRVAVIALSSLVLMLLLKYLFQRKRPLSPLLSAAKGLSFPSGHAIMAVTFYGMLLHIMMFSGVADWLKFMLAVLLVVLIFLIGYSRVYLRVHYASDVLAGFIIGVLWLIISMAVLNTIEDLFYARS
jgi:undecaprenyl-diphosphatase